MENKRVSVLGTEYEIEISTILENPMLANADAYCDTTIKKIVIGSPTADIMNCADIGAYQRKLYRHELVHAFLYESGLGANSDWGNDETLVDWIALQFPKMARTFVEAGCMDAY